MHGWGLAQRIETMSGDVFAIQQGTLYPALQRMKRKGWIRSEWRVTKNTRRGYAGPLGQLAACRT